MKDVFGKCRNTCWAIAVASAAIVMIYTTAFTERGFVAGILLGALTLSFVGKIAIWMFCDGVPTGSMASMPNPVTSSAAGKPTPLPLEQGEPVSGSVDPAGVAKPALEKPIDEPEPENAPEKTALARDRERPETVETGGEDAKPRMLDGPRNGAADDLKKIKGIGPKLEQLCFDLGIYHFDQIADWSPQEIAWMDANLQGFKGRVSRDHWVDQARILASGGQNEFSARAEGGPVS